MTDIEPELLQRAQAGDRDAHAALYRAFAPMVYTLARRMLGSRALAEDVLQDCFVEVIRKAGQFRGDCPVGAWIRRIAVNKALSQLRSPWRRRRALLGSDGRDAGWTCSDGDAADAASAVDLAASPEPATTAQLHGPRLLELERALDALSATARAVVWLHVVEGYTHREIGRMMGRTSSFSKSQLARACEQLRQLMQTEVIEAESEPCLGILKPV